MPDEKPKCSQCGTELEGRDVYEGLCRQCREEAVLKRPVSAVKPRRIEPIAPPRPAAHASSDAIVIEADVDPEADTKEIMLLREAGRAAAAPPAAGGRGSSSSAIFIELGEPSEPPAPVEPAPPPPEQGVSLLDISFEETPRPEVEPVTPKEGVPVLATGPAPEATPPREVERESVERKALSVEREAQEAKDAPRSTPDAPRALAAPPRPDADIEEPILRLAGPKEVEREGAERKASSVERKAQDGLDASRSTLHAASSTLGPRPAPPPSPRPEDKSVERDSVERREREVKDAPRSTLDARRPSPPPPPTPLAAKPGPPPPLSRASIEPEEPVLLSLATDERAGKREGRAAPAAPAPEQPPLRLQAAPSDIEMRALYERLAHDVEEVRSRLRGSAGLAVTPAQQVAFGLRAFFGFFLGSALLSLAAAGVLALIGIFYPPSLALLKRLLASLFGTP